MRRAPGPAAAMTWGRYSAIVGTRGRARGCRSARVTPSWASIAWAVAIRAGSADITPFPGVVELGSSRATSAAGWTTRRPPAGRRPAGPAAAPMPVKARAGAGRLTSPRAVTVYRPVVDAVTTIECRPRRCPGAGRVANPGARPVLGWDSRPDGSSRATSNRDVGSPVGSTVFGAEPGAMPGWADAGEPTAVSAHRSAARRHEIVSSVHNDYADGRLAAPGLRIRPDRRRAQLSRTTDDSAASVQHRRGKFPRNWCRRGIRHRYVAPVRNARVHVLDGTALQQVTSPDTPVAPHSDLAQQPGSLHTKASWAARRKRPDLPMTARSYGASGAVPCA